MSEVHEAGVPSCPNCGQMDRVSGVSASHLSGQETLHLAVSTTDGQVAKTLTMTDPLTAALAPPTRPEESVRGCLGFLLLLGGLGTYVCAAASGAWWDGVQDFTPHGTYAGLAWLGVVAFVLGVLATGATVVRGTVRKRKLAVARDHALTLWSHGWYCARCNTVHFCSGSDSPSQTMSLAEFRSAVWGASDWEL